MAGVAGREGAGGKWILSSRPHDRLIGAATWRAREVKRWYHLSGSIYYSGRFRF